MMPTCRTKTPKPTSRFLALPPELRLRIYEELLPIKQAIGNVNKVACHSQILRVCKTCYREGKPVLQRLNKVQIRACAYVLSDGLPNDPLFFEITLKLGGNQNNLWRLFEILPLSAGTCHEVHRRWRDSLQVGCKLRTTLGLSYKSTTMAQLVKFMEKVRQSEREGKPIDRRSFGGFKTTTMPVPTGGMSFAEILQLAFAIEHLAPSSPRAPVSFVSSDAWDYRRMIGDNYAYELLTKASESPNTAMSRRIYVRMAGWTASRMLACIPMWMVKFVVRSFFNSRHARRADFRYELGEARNKVHILKHSHLKRSESLPYAGPAVVQQWLPVIENFFREQYAHHTLKRGDTEAGTS